MKISILTYICVVLFGTGSWIAINGIWVELPNLVNQTPEHWKLASYLTVICQLANIGPILYAFLKSKARNKDFLERWSIYVLLIIGCVACILLSQFWRRTSTIAGSERSTVLLALTFVIALVDCTSSVTFLPFMSIFSDVYMSSLYIGETFSGFIPSLVALAQGVVEVPSNKTNGNSSIASSNSSGLRFSQEIFFLMLALLMILCFVAFTALNYLPAIKQQHINRKEVAQVNRQLSNYTGDPQYTANEEDRLLSKEKEVSLFSLRRLYFLLFIMTCLNFLQNGVLSSVSSYACAPYGTLTYHLVATLGNISSALSCFVYLWLPNKCVKKILLGSCLYFSLAIYMLVMAVLSPHPLWYNATTGKVIIILVSIVMSSLVSYSKLSIATVMRCEGHKFLFYLGISNQVGSFVGAVLMFPIVNYTSIFKSE